MLKKILSTVLAVAMIGAMSTNVMASEVESGENNQDYTVVASITEELGDGLTLVKELSIPTEELVATYSFVGSTTGRVEHKYLREGNTVATIIAYAVFQCGDDNKTTIYDCNNSISNKDGYKNNIFNPVPSTVENQPEFFNPSVNYAKYSVSYSFSGLGGGDTLWIKCNSLGSLSDSGDKVHGKMSNQFDFKGSTISFG